MNTQQLVQQACLVVYRGDSYQVVACETEFFYAVHESTGDEVWLYYDQLDLTRDRIYGLQLLNPY